MTAVTLKTKEELINDGWVLGAWKDSERRWGGDGLYLPRAKSEQFNPLLKINSNSVLMLLLGSKGKVVDWNSSGEPSYQVFFDKEGSIQKVDWRLLKEGFFKPKGISDNKKTLQVLGHDIEVFTVGSGKFFHLSCSFNKLTGKQLLEVAKKVLPEIGYKPVKKGGKACTSK